MKTILMVEDDPKIALALGIRLKSMGYLVEIARDAATAVSQVRKVKPDVVLLDISLPGGDGFLVAERINNLVGSAATPIIFVTASARPDLEELVKRAGGVGLLRKPFSATALADAIELCYTSGDSWLARESSSAVG